MRPTQPTTKTRTAPQVLRKVGLGMAAVLAVVLLSGCLTEEQDSVARELNADRRASGLPVLAIDHEASTKAQRWAERLASENALYHSDLLDGFMNLDGVCGVRENVGYGPNVELLQDAYMNSPSHRANVLATDVNRVGVGHARRGDTIWTVHVLVNRC